MLKQLVAGFVAVVMLAGEQNISEAQYILVKGSVDCGKWFKARNVGQAGIFEAYLQGLLNGFAMGTGFNFWQAGGREISPDAAYLWMDGYCRDHPLNGVGEGAIALFREQGWRPPQ